MNQVLALPLPKWNVESVVKGGLLKHKYVDHDAYWKGHPHKIEAVTEDFFIFNEGINFFKGIIRGLDMEPVVYLYNSFDDLSSYLDLDEWIYYTREVI